MHDIGKTIGLGLLLALATSPATAQVVYQSAEVEEEAVEEIRIYRVEMVVFEHTDANESGTEVFLPEPPPVADVPSLPAIRPGEVPEFTQVGPLLPAPLGPNDALFGQELPIAIDVDCCCLPARHRHGPGRPSSVG